MGILNIQGARDLRQCRKSRQEGTKMKLAYLVILSRTNISYGTLLIMLEKCSYLAMIVRWPLMSLSVILGKGTTGKFMEREFMDLERNRGNE